METYNLIEKLVSVPAVGGDEERIITVLKEILSPYGEVEVDAVNNVICTFGSGYHILLDAHIDEIGLIVTSIADDGFLKVAACGGVDKRMLLGSEVTVWGKETLCGVISTLPPHLQKASDEKKVTEVSEISVDVGLDKETAEKLIPLGSKITFKRQFTKLLNNQISSNCLDDRAGVASLILALDELKKLPIKVTVLLSTQEELGTRGAKSGPYGRIVDEAIAVDVSFGYTPGCDKEECGEIGKGAMIGISPTLDKNISKELVEAAKESNIQYQLEVMNGRTGTNADVISISENGIKCGLLSIPLKYMHSPVEVVDLSDVESVSNLIVAYAKRKAGAENA
ncbi:MAG: M42 family peptidase [Eubacterium sp.]|nr:M42 family peptidase [Eubacterium sp.]